jgi:flavin-dependent dehydrogenase
MEARAVVLANGFNSLLAKQGGLGSPDYFTTGVQAEVESGQLDEVEVYFGQRRAPGFFAWLVPTSKGKALAGLMSRETPGLYLRKWLCELQAQGRINAGVYPIRYSGIPLKYLNRTSLDRTLVVGDAAGQVKSTTGGGLYFGLICADIVAETLHNALMADNLTAQMLSQYDRLWKQKLEPELKKEYFARKAYEHLADNQINWLFRFLESSDIVEPLLNDESILFDWHGGLLLKVLRQCALSPARKILKFGRI